MNVRIKTALISVFYKDGIDDLATYLHQNGVQILSTGGTQKHLENLGIPVTPVESITSYPSILGGRVKTLHPAVFGGILNRSENENDARELSEHHIGNIDLIWVDLYPFTETLQSTSDESAIIEKIDIGGVSLIRAAAKNYRDKLIICQPTQVNRVHTHLTENGLATDISFRKAMAAEAFQTTRDYDTAISGYFEYGAPVSLRYGENPHQPARFEGKLDDVFTQLHGKEISYNNLLDIDAALGMVKDMDELNQPVFAILKHNNACGLSVGTDVTDAYKKALQADPVSAFGGVLCTNQTITAEVANEMNDLFFEVLMAPDFSQEALDILQQKKNRILLQTKSFSYPKTNRRSVLNGELIQERDSDINAIPSFDQVTTATPTSDQLNDLWFANVIVKHTKSNAIVLVKNGQLLAAGTGQTSRVDALNQAIAKARHFGFDLTGAVMASDAFFPFPDCVEIADGEGINAVIQPGGSIKDQLTIDYCDAHHIAMVTTGMRHFKH